MHDLTKGNITKQLLRFAFPLLLGNLFQLFYSFADIWVIGRYLGDSSITAVGSISTLNDLIIGFILGLTNGFAVITARKFGCGDKESVRNSVGHSVLFGFSISIILTVLSLVFLPQLMVLMQVPFESISEGSEYVRIIIGGMTVSMCYNVCASTLRAIGDSVIPLVFLILSSVINIGLDFLFVNGFNGGVAGAAWATVLSQGISAVLCVVYIIIKYPLLHIKLHNIKPQSQMSKEILSCGISMGLMNSLVSLGTVILQTAINQLGNTIIIAHTAARKNMGMFIMPIGVMSMTIASFCGQNYGAEKYDRIREGIKKSIIYTWIWCIVSVIIIYLFSPALIKFVTSTESQDVIYNGSRYLKIDCLLYWVTAVIIIFRNALQALGNHKVPVFSSFIELTGKILVAKLLAPAIGYMGIILAEPMVWVVMVIPLVICLVRNPAIRNKA